MFSSPPQALGSIFFKFIRYNHPSNFLKTFVSNTPLPPPPSFIVFAYCPSLYDLLPPSLAIYLLEIKLPSAQHPSLVILLLSSTMAMRGQKTELIKFYFLFILPLEMIPKGQNPFSIGSGSSVWTKVEILRNIRMDGWTLFQTKFAIQVLRGVL